MEQERMVQEFLELVSISSPSLGERQLADVVKAKLLALGCDVEEDGVAPKIGGTAGNISDLGGYFNELLYFTDRAKTGGKIEQASLKAAADSLRFLLEKELSFQG